jgi:NADH-quinone oxidoreductase subunit N
MQQTDFAIVLPEIALAVYAMAALMLAVYTSKDGMTRIITWATVGVFLALAAWIGLCARPEGTAFGAPPASLR